MKYIYISALFAAASLAASAQSLNKEIDIEREIHPTLRAVSRLNNLPTLLQPSIPQTHLTFSDQTTAADVQPMITVLSPAASDNAIEQSPYRGYAAIGYFPSFNMGASAGYRFINKPTSRLSAWIQYDGNSYKSRMYGIGDKLTFRRHTLNAAVDFTHIFRNAGRLDLSADYTYNSLTRPWVSNPDNLSANSFRLEADWSARRRELAYFASATYTYFGFGDSDGAINALVNTPDATIDNINENRIDIKAGTAYFITSNSSLAGVVGADFIHYNHFNTYVPYFGPAFGNGRTMGVITLLPQYRYNSGIFRADIGLRLQFTSNSGKTLHAAPDVNLTVRPADGFTAFLKLGGGEHINSFSSLFDFTPYMSPSVAYRTSHIPFTADLGFTVGPFRGLSVEIGGGYAVANDWLMPIAYRNTYLFEATDLRALHGDVKVRWKHSDMLTVEAAYSIAPGSERHAYYLNRDRAKHVASISAKVNPIEHLTVDAAFEFRGGRSACMYEFPAPDDPDDNGHSSIDLGNAADINLGATYSIHDNFSVFLRGENLLNRRADLLPGLEAQGIKGLAGVTFKF